jgi:ubiquinone/menaquinone biosynthesis C-methylase UbiE
MLNHNHSHHADGNQNFINKIAFLDSSMRKNALPPEEILNMLPIQNDSSILDAGAGSGYLSIPAAKQIVGTVFALDMDDRMLGVIDTKAKADKLTNIQLIQGNIDNIPLPNNSADIALASLILHEVKSLPVALMQISRVLKPGGHILCMEYEKEESTVKGPPMHIRISSSNMEQALLDAGFHPVQKVFPRESIYIITAKKAGGAAE